MIYWNVRQWIFSDCLAFHRNLTEFYTSFLKKFYIYSLSILLPTSRAAFWKNLTWSIAAIWRPILWFLRKIWLSDCLPSEKHFFIIINQNVGYPSIHSCCIFQKNSAVFIQNTVFTEMFCICKIYCQHLIFGNICAGIMFGI